jgi:hypothetical protein
MEEFIEGNSKGNGADKPIPEIKLQFHKTDVYGKVTSSANVAELLRKLFPIGSIELQEQAIVLYLNRANQVVGYYRHTSGGVNATIMDMKLILSAALKSLSSGIIIAHNHPSGNLAPSEEDKRMTNKIAQGAKSIDLNLLDHIILTKEGYYSFSDEGQLNGLNGYDQKPDNEDIVNDRKNSAKEADARTAAKHLIYGYVKRGDTVEQLKAGQLGRHDSNYSATIKRNKIIVDRIGHTSVEFSFPLQSIYNEIVDDLGNSAPKRHQQQKTKEVKTAMKKKAVKSSRIVAKAPPLPVERINEEVRFIRRFVMMNGKKKTDVQLLNLLSGLQKAILEKRIRKTSKYKDEIEQIQKTLVEVTNNMRRIPFADKRIKQINLKPEVLKHLREIAGSQAVRLSVNYLKRYVGIQGKFLTKEKAQRLYDTLQRAVQKKRLVSSDPFAKQLNAVWMSLGEFLKSANQKATLEIHPEVLNGLNVALDGCACEEKKKDVPEITAPVLSPVANSNTVMNSLDFAKLKFDTLGFTGKWLGLIGDPCAGFRTMVFGKPKMGKSYLCIEFAGYLARHHGDTLYVAKEEKLDATLQKKLNDKDVKHRCLYVSDHLPEDLSAYQFIFLDSVSKLKLTPEQLDSLKAANPGKSFVEVYQTTKEGKFRGTNEHQHDVDIVIELPERGKAVQFGRFNQGGEMTIF